MQPMRSWTCTQEGSSFSLGKGGRNFIIVVFLSCSHVFPMICPNVFVGLSIMFLRFPMSSPRVFQIAAHWFGASSRLLSYIGRPKERDSIHIETSNWGSLSSFSFCFFGDERIKMTHGKKTRNYNWEAVHLVNRIGKVFFGRAISLGQK